VSRSSWLSVAAASLAFLAGCGGSGASSLPKPQYIARADAVCRAGNAYATGGLAQDRLTKGLVTVDRGVAVVREVRAAIQITADRLRSIPLPTGDASIPRTVVASADQEATLLGQLEVALMNRDKAALTQLTARINRVDARASELALRYGFAVCGRLLS
jgi:hypothetical protein